MKWAREFLVSHHAPPGGRSAADADSLAAWFEAGATGLQPAEVAPAQFERGAALYPELGCVACHDAKGVDGIANKRDLRSLVEFLIAPRNVRPDLPWHDFRLADAEADAVAAWLLRETVQGEDQAPAVPGFHFACYEVQIENAGLPPLDGVAAAAEGHTDVISVAPKTRGNHFALRFTAQLRIDRAGRYRFRVGSDDSSWLLLDGEFVIRNEGLAPFRWQDGSVELSAGWHDFEVLFTEATGGERLEFAWRPPGVRRWQKLPADQVSSRTTSLVPPVAQRPAGNPAAGRELATAGRCAACHDGLGLEAAAAATPWDALPAGRDCSAVRAGGEPPVVPGRAAIDPGLLPPAERLARELDSNSCLSCHDRGGDGGMRESALSALTEVEDLGEEGRRPPSLDLIGHRLRPEWTERVLNGSVDARPYVRARCVRMPDDEARRIARLFDAVDAKPGDDVEPAFSAQAVREGRRIVGTGGFACIACHSAAGRKGIGVQGMDLTEQHARLKPVWFREWLLRPFELRKGTRMPAFWGGARTPANLAQIDAVRVWSSLGSAAPLPDGIAIDRAAFTLESDGRRPKLHGAFLQGLSAKCLAVGSPERVHYAFDLQNGRLGWLWRGDFLDASGTWKGRAGKLLKPAGEDWLVMPEGVGLVAADGLEEFRDVVGWNVDRDGYPVFRVRVGDNLVTQELRPRWGHGGAELVRTFTASAAGVALRVPELDGLTTLVDGRPVSGLVQLPAGQSLEVVQRW